MYGGSTGVTALGWSSEEVDRIISEHPLLSHFPRRSVSVEAVGRELYVHAYGYGRDYYCHYGAFVGLEPVARLETLRLCKTGVSCVELRCPPVGDCDLEGRAVPGDLGRALIGEVTRSAARAAQSLDYGEVDRAVSWGLGVLAKRFAEEGLRVARGLAVGNHLDSMSEEDRSLLGLTLALGLAWALERRNGALILYRADPSGGEVVQIYVRGNLYRLDQSGKLRLGGSVHRVDPGEARELMSRILGDLVKLKVVDPRVREVAERYASEMEALARKLA